MQPGVTELSLRGRGPRRAFVFDEHRLALPCWEEVGARGAVLLTLDRHFDTVPRTGEPDPRNVDHILAAMERGVLTEVIAIARARPVGSTGPGEKLIGAPTVDALLNGPDAKRALEWIARAGSVVLDFDLDCFTTPSDADPTTIVPWPIELIRDHVMPRGSEPFWDAVLSRCLALTFAREPKHCGGLIATGRLFEQAAQVVFCELLKADLP
jgi:hypothetical protein